MLLETAALSVFAFREEDGSLDLNLVPGIGIFVDVEEGSLLEESIESAVELIESCMKAYARVGTVPEPVEQLAAVYREVADN